MSEYNQLTGSDYINSIDRLSTDDTSSPRSMKSRSSQFISSGSSVSSKLSRSSRFKQKSDLGIPLTLSMEDEVDDGSESQWVGNGGGDEGKVSSPSSAVTNGHAFAEDDPFYIFRGDLMKKLSSVEGELEKYLDVVRNTDTAVNTHEVKETKKQLKRHIKQAESTLADLETTVRVVEKQREKFPHITDKEITERRGFVDSSKNQISRAKSGMQSEEVKKKFARDERALTERRSGTAIGGIDKNRPPPLESGNGGDDSFLEEGRSETMMMMKRQDETLDDLGMAVTRVGYMAESIHEEIDHQNKMLRELEDDLADAEEQLGLKLHVRV
ncbi:hypothetical protein ACHAXS_006974 [Conticribra weissflogii]